MSITRKGNQKNKGDRGMPRAHDSPVRKSAVKSGGKPGEIECIENWLESVKFKKTAFGGVSEADVWRKIAELNEMYETALTAERARYDLLLQTCSSKAGRAAGREVGREAGEQSPSHTPVKHRSVRSEETGASYEDISNIPPGSWSRDAPIQKSDRATVSRSDSKESQSVRKPVKPVAAPRKSARPKGVPFMETDWVDDEEEDDWLDFDSEAAFQPKSSNSRREEGQ